MRVIAGDAKGRVLATPHGLDIRPTTDRVREAIFSMLDAECLKRTTGGFCFPRVLDLYAGTGALGIEALSRGASHADFVETNPKARAIIAENLRRTGLIDRGAIHGLKVQSALSTFQGTYDLILLDPPYGDPTLPLVLEALGRSPILISGTIVVLEHARSFDVPTQVGRLLRTRSRHHGTTAVSFFVPETPGLVGAGS